MKITALALLLTAGPALAQGDQYQEAAARYDACFWRSANQQLQQTSDRSQAAEQAFAACATEERFILALAALNRISPQMAEAVLLKRKLDLKRQFVGN